MLPFNIVFTSNGAKIRKICKHSVHSLILLDEEKQNEKVSASIAAKHENPQPTCSALVI